MEEIWKNIKGYEEKYKVSNKGRIKNIKTNNIISQNVSNCGYYRVGLYLNNKKENKEVHRIVAETFINNPENKKEVNHIDGDKSNNNMDNLEWVTHKENIKHAWTNKLFEHVREASKRYGKDNPLAKGIIQYDLKGNKVKEYDSIMDAVRETNINKTSIGKCCNRRQNTAGGYIWKFKK